MTVAPDGKNVYATGYGSNSIVHWNRGRPTCVDTDDSGTSFDGSTCSAGYTFSPTDTPCATTGCDADDCCDENPTCDNIDGNGADFASCVSGTNHLKEDLTDTCATGTCAASDCCDGNPTCDDIDGTGADFASCVSGTNHLKEDLTGTCATGTCAASDCCNAVAEESGPSPVSTSETLPAGDADMSDSSITSSSSASSSKAIANGKAGKSFLKKCFDVCGMEYGMERNMFTILAVEHVYLSFSTSSPRPTASIRASAATAVKYAQTAAAEVAELLSSWCF